MPSKEDLHTEDIYDSSEFWHIKCLKISIKFYIHQKIKKTGGFKQACVWQCFHWNPNKELESFLDSNKLESFFDWPVLLIQITRHGFMKILFRSFEMTTATDKAKQNKG